MLKVTYLINDKEYVSAVSWRDLKMFRQAYNVVKVEFK